MHVRLRSDRQKVIFGASGIVGGAGISDESFYKTFKPPLSNASFHSTVIASNHDDIKAEAFASIVKW